MSKTYLSYQRIIDYLKGILSNRHRHDLEKEVMRDAFEEEAFEGLNLLTADELESDMRRMEDMVDKRTMKPDRKIMPVVVRIAAAVILVVGIGSVLYVTLFNRSKTPGTDYIAESNEISQPPEKSESEALPSQEERASVARTEPVAPSVLPEERPLTETARTAGPQMPEQMTTEDELQDAQAVIAENKMVVTEKDIAAEGAAQLQRAPAAAMEAESAIRVRAERESGQLPAPPDSYTARVVDNSGSPVSGVAVYKKGVIKGAVTDMNGIFSIAVTHPASDIILSSVAFREMDLEAADRVVEEFPRGNEILSLKEVVIGSDITVKKSSVQGEPVYPSTAVPQNLEILPTYEVSSPVPPGGTLRAYKKLVENNLDAEELAASVEQLEDFTGRYWIDVTMTILIDGSVRNILFDGSVPQVVTKAYRTSIESLPSWQPALQGNTPVESEVEMRFMLSIE